MICIDPVGLLHVGQATGGARVLIWTCWTLRQRLVATWAEFQHSVVYCATDQCRKRLEACTNAEGGHSEHLLWRCLPDIPVATHHNRFFSEPPTTTHNWLSWDPPTSERHTHLCIDYWYTDFQSAARYGPVMLRTCEKSRSKVYRLERLRETSQTRDGRGSIFLHPTQPNPSTYGPNPPIIHLREMQTPALYNPYFYMSVD